jgi:8-oxo-dGTP pyrophosphatase MutT (NUDIX family)
VTRIKTDKPRKKSRKPARAAAAVAIAPPAREQVAALPWRQRDSLEILLVSSRETRRWIIPKGWPMAGRSGAASAVIEAIEEAGLLGVISAEPIGHYTYAKRFSRKVEPCRVAVYSLRVVRQRQKWPEKAERETRWFPALDAMEAVSDPELRELVARFIVSR